METIPLTPEGIIVSPSQDPHAEVNFEVQVEDTTTRKPETDTTIPEKEVAYPPTLAETRLEENLAENKFKKLSRTCKRLRKLVKHLRKQFKEVNKAQKPKKELTTVETQK